MAETLRDRWIGLLFAGASILSIGLAASARDHVAEVSSRTVTDVDGNVYSAVTIGSQVWLARNLETTRYCDGAEIPRLEEAGLWSTATAGAWCEPAPGPSADAREYGLLYNHFAVRDPRGLCPDGWHVPTAEEWRALIDHLGGAEIAGSRMKVTADGAWVLLAPGSTNDSGFSALPAGGRGRLGDAGESGRYATWWSSTRDEAMYAWHWGLHPDSHAIRYNPGHVQSGFSVRCIEDKDVP